MQDNTTVRLDNENEPQPDALLRIEPSAGGMSCIDQDDYIAGAPELIVEIAASSATYDLNDKLVAYCRNRVKEYLVWQVYEQQLTWFKLQAGQYIVSQPEEGVIRSSVFPGLWLAVDALCDDRSKLLAVLQVGLQSPEHQEFIQRLKSPADDTPDS